MEKNSVSGITRVFLLPAVATILVALETANAQTWNGTPATTTTTDYNTSIQLTHIGWGAHHGILFNAYRSPSLVDGFLNTVGNTKHSFDVGSYQSGAGALMYIANGGRMDFLLSESSTGAGTNVSWGPPKLTILRNGNVGVGTDNPDSKLSVKGHIHAQEVNVDLNGAVAPDYVFDPRYTLPSLKEIKSYIEEHRHLPEIPSAKVMETSGLNLGEMNLLLLKKVEELTLHIIEQEERISALEKRRITE